MKHKILTLFFSGILSLTGFSQLSFGPKAGGNYTNVIGAFTDGHKFRPGWHTGLVVEYEFANYLSFQFEGVYSVKGFRYKNTESVANSKLKLFTVSDYNVLYSYRYIDLPLILNIHFRGTSDLGSYIGVGPQFSFLNSAYWKGSKKVTIVDNSTTPNTSTVIEGTETGNNKNGLKKMDFGLVLGFGSKWDSGIEYCIRGGYSAYNSLDASTMNSTNSWRSFTWHNLAFTVSIGYMFGRSIGGMYITEKRNHYGLGQNYRQNNYKKRQKK